MDRTKFLNYAFCLIFIAGMLVTLAPITMALLPEKNNPALISQVVVALAMICLFAGFGFGVSFEPMNVAQNALWKSIQESIRRYENIPNGIVFDEQGAHPHKGCTAHQAIHIEQWITEHHPMLDPIVLQKIKEYFGGSVHFHIDDAIIVRHPDGWEIKRLEILS